MPKFTNGLKGHVEVSRDFVGGFLSTWVTTLLRLGSIGLMKLEIMVFVISVPIPIPFPIPIPMPTQQTFVGLEDLLKTSWKRRSCYAEDALKTSWRHVLKMSWRHVFKTSQRFYGDKKNTYWGCLYTYLGITNLNVYLTSLYFTNLYLTILKRIQNALIRTQ